MKFVKVKDLRFPDLDHGYVLQISNESELKDYYQKSVALKVRDAWDNLIDVANGLDHVNSNMALVLQLSADGKKSLLELSNEFLSTVFYNQLKAINKYGSIYINMMGGYFIPHKDIAIEKEIHLEHSDIIFPNFSEKDITVKQWENGTHWYAYVGGIWVNYKGKNKFNSKSEALRIAKYQLKLMKEQMYTIKNL